MVLIIFLYIYIDLLLNCIEITTPRSLSRFRFISRRPSTTPRSKTTTKLPEIKNSDQTIESSNQQSLEENANDGDTTELGDIAAALYDIQQAPIPKKTSAITYPFSSTTTRSPTKRKCENNLVDLLLFKKYL